MSQDREPPAYQEYAAAMLANLGFRLLTLAQRGLLYTMRNECWVNLRLPADPVSLAVVLGQPESEIADALPAIMPFFAQADGYITCPELVAYRLKLDTNRQKQSEGGKAGAEMTNKGKRKGRKARVDSNVTGNPPGKSLSDPAW